MIVMESRRNRRESVESAIVAASIGWLTEDEPLGRGQHVQRNGDLILVLLPLQPLQQVRRLVHEGGYQKESEGGEGDCRWIEHVNRGRHFARSARRLKVFAGSVVDGVFLKNPKRSIDEELRGES